VLKRAIHLMLHHDLNLTKKSARWVLKLLTEDMKKERMRTREDFFAMVRCLSMAILNNMCHYGQIAMLFHTPEAKQQ
jgi:hypothetical protein